MIFLDEGRLLVQVQDPFDLDRQALRVRDDRIGPDPQARVLGVGLDDDGEADLEGLVLRGQQLAGRGRQVVGTENGLGHVLILADGERPGLVPGEGQVHQLKGGGHVRLPLRPAVKSLAQVDQDVEVQVLDPAEEIEEALLQGDDGHGVAEFFDGLADLLSDLGDGLLRELFFRASGDRFVGVEDDADVGQGIRHCFNSTW